MRNEDDMSTEQKLNATGTSNFEQDYGTDAHQLVNAYEKRFSGATITDDVMRTVNRDDQNSLTNIKISYV